jgi:hypothetical protein
MKPDLHAKNAALARQATQARKARRWKRMTELCQQNRDVMTAMLRKEIRHTRKAA